MDRNKSIPSSTETSPVKRYLQSIVVAPKAIKYDYLYGHAHSQSAQAFGLIQHVIGPLLPQLQPVCGGEVEVNLSFLV